MAGNMKAVKLRIKSVQSTMQITKAMELVASSKLRKAKERAETCRPYFTELHETLKDIAKENIDFSSVYSRESSNPRTCYVVIAGDRGLAGGYNANLFKCLESAAEGRDYMVLPIGKKAVEYFRQRGIECLTDKFAEIAGISVADCFEIANLLCEEFRKGTFGHIELCYTVFASMLQEISSSMSRMQKLCLMPLFRNIWRDWFMVVYVKVQPVNLQPEEWLWTLRQVMQKR